MSFIKILSRLAKYKYFLLVLSIIFIIPFTPLPIISSSHLPIISDAWSATYYVDATGGNDGNSGISLSTSWKTIAKVNASSFNPGDQILFRRGQTWREQLTVPSSGSAGNPITFGAYGSGDNPIITAADIITGWTGGSSNINYGDSTAGSPNDTYYGNYVYYWKLGTITTGGTVVSISFRSGSTVSTKTKCAIYTDNGSGTAPQSLVTNSVSNEVKQTPNIWNTYTFSTNPTVNDNTTYWLAFYSASNVSVRCAGSPTNNIGYQSRNYSSGFPSTATHSNMGSASDVDWYMTVQPNTNVIFYKGTYSSNPNGLIRNGSLMANVNLKTNLTQDTQWCYDSTNQVVYVYGDPSADTVEIPARIRAVHTNSKDYLTFHNLQLESGTGSSAYVSNGSDNITFDGITIKNAYYGIDVQSSVGNNGTVKNSHISYTYDAGICLNASSATGWIIQNNEVDHCGTIPYPQFMGTSHPSGVYVNMSDVLLEYNNIHDNGTSKTSDHGAYIVGTTLIARYNKFYGNSCSGLKIYSCSNVQVYYNLTYGNDIGMLYQTNSTGGKIWNNVIYGNSGDGNGHGLSISENATLAELYNNVIAENVYGGTSGAGQVWVDATSSITSSDYNLIYYSAGGNICVYRGANKTFPQWQALGLDSHGVNADPFFVNARTDFHLRAGSPCIDTGTNVGLTTDHTGNPIYGTPDIGAYEYHALPTAPKNLRILVQ